MKFTLSWLKEHLETDASLDIITERLTMIGLEVEKIIDKADSLKDFLVADVLEVKNHPNADRLKVCKVNNGSSIFEVVCGAPNVRVGIKGVFAPPNSYIPGTGIKLKPTKIRGVLSNGMLLSEREIGISDEHDGIIELSTKAPIGAIASQILNLDDPIIEIAITPNRGDCLGVRGIARDLSASGLGNLKPLAHKPVPGIFNSPIEVKLNFSPNSSNACPYFIGRYIRKVQNGESPEWLKDKLTSIGLRPISALVDITNLMTFDLGRPLHVFDGACLNGNLEVRLAKLNEGFLGLDGKEYTLDDTMCVITDEEKVQAIGGIIGGENSGCTTSTTNVFLECAYFNPIRTATTGRKLQINSDARFRFERGVDPDFLTSGAEIATRLILDLCGGEPSTLLVSGTKPDIERKIELRLSRVKSLSGVNVPKDDIQRILLLLGFSVEGEHDVLKVSVPTWRNDIVSEACLVEEVIRIFGFDKIPIVPIKLDTSLPERALEPFQQRQFNIRRLLAQRGLTEAVTYSFLSSNDARLFGGINPKLKLVNPISGDLSSMRPSLLPNLINAAQKNSAHANPNSALFEIGPQFNGDKPVDQIIIAAGIRCIEMGERHWLKTLRPVDVFDVKSDVLNALTLIWSGTKKLHPNNGAASWYHPGRSGTYRLGPQNILAYFGEIHPTILNEMNIKGTIVGFEIFIDNIPFAKDIKTARREHLKIPPYQKIERDFSFIVDKEINASKLVSAAINVDKNLITNVKIFDIFLDKALGENKKSIAINATFQPTLKSLTDKEIDGISQQIVKSVKMATGGVLRE